MTEKDATPERPQLVTQASDLPLLAGFWMKGL